MALLRRPRGHRNHAGLCISRFNHYGSDSVCKHLPVEIDGYFKRHRNYEVKMLALQDFLILWISNPVSALRT